MFLRVVVVGMLAFEFSILPLVLFLVFFGFMISDGVKVMLLKRDTSGEGKEMVDVYCWKNGCRVKLRGTK